jgi:hypothetical protein
MKLPSALYLILATFLILTGVYNSITPYREPGTLRYQWDIDSETGQIRIDPITGQRMHQTANDIGAPDERQHANYITHLVEGKGFPVLKVGDPEAYENYQSHQPPLYYILAAGWSKITAAPPAEPTSGFRLRFLSSIIGLASLLGIYFAGIWGLQRQDIALAATAFAALLPMNISLHAAISNDPLLYALVTWVFALAVKGLQQGWSLKLALTIGALTGLAILTKTTGLVCIPVIATALLMRDPDPERRPKNAALIWASALGTGLLIALPWLLRNKGLYGDFFAVSVFNAAFTGSPQASNFIQMFGAQGYWLNMVLWWTARSFIGAFGYMDIFMFESLPKDNSSPIPFLIGAIALGMCAFGVSKLPLQHIEDVTAQSNMKKYAELGGIIVAVLGLLFLLLPGAVPPTIRFALLVVSIFVLLGLVTFTQSRSLAIITISLTGIAIAMSIFSSAPPSESAYFAVLGVFATILLFGQIGFREIKAEADDQALPQPKRFQILHLILLAFTTLLFIRFNLQYFQGQARYLFPAMVSFAYLFAFGSVRLMKAKPQLAFLVPTIFLGLLNFAAIQAITSGFPLRQQ